MRWAGAVLLVVLMAIGSVAMWLAVPVFWVYLASRLADSAQPSAALILMIVVGIAVSMIVLAKLLGVLNHAHQVLTGTLPGRRDQTVWMRSMRGEREFQRQHGVLGTVMTVSVSIALACLGVWFLFFAEGGGI